jgi:Zn-dependent peptidase ImmA (M78 family)/DNA-binding XRE family transcriptional regulator
MPDDTTLAIGAAVREHRKRRGLSQAKLAGLLGLGSAQSISTIENGDRNLKASELTKLAEILCVSPMVLLKGATPADEPFVLWRDGRMVEENLREKNDFLERCQRYAFLEDLSGEESGPKLPQMYVNLEDLDYSKIESLADQARCLLNLGDVPATGLRETLEGKWGLKLFFSDLSSASGATTRGDFGDAVVENRSEPPSRRVYSLGHELFHLLTWDSVASHVAGLPQELERKNEKFANAFASYLLMPKKTLLERLEGKRIERLVDLLPVAQFFEVSLPALLWRLVTLGRVERERVRQFLDPSDSWWGKTDENWDREKDPEKPLPRRYVSLAFMAYINSGISIGKLAELMETSVGMLKPTLSRYDIDLESDDYQTAVLSA